MKRINERYNKEVELSELKELCKNKRERLDKKDI